MEHVLHNEEDAVTAAIEAHRQQHGMGDARTMAKVVLDHLESHRARKIAANAARIASLEAALAATNVESGLADA